MMRPGDWRAAGGVPALGGFLHVSLSHNRHSVTLK